MVKSSKKQAVRTYELDVAIIRDHDVLGLHVPVDDTKCVQVIERFHDASDDKLGGRIVESTVSVQGRSQITAQARFHQKVEIYVVLKRSIQSVYRSVYRS